MKIQDARISNLAGRVNISLMFPEEDYTEACSLFGGLDPETDYEIRIEKKQKKRSLDANAYAWVLIKKLAKHYSIPPVEVYRRQIVDMPCYDILPIKNEVLQRWKKNWTSKGMGWICEELGPSKFPNYTNTINYYGSSVYSSADMAKLIDNLISECQSADIYIADRAEIERAKREWGL